MADERAIEEERTEKKVYVVLTKIEVETKHLKEVLKATKGKFTLAKERIRVIEEKAT